MEIVKIINHQKCEDKNEWYECVIMKNMGMDSYSLSGHYLLGSRDQTNHNPSEKNGSIRELDNDSDDIELPDVSVLPGHCVYVYSGNAGQTMAWAHNQIVVNKDNKDHSVFVTNKFVWNDNGETVSLVKKTFHIEEVHSHSYGNVPQDVMENSDENVLGGLFEN